MKVILNWVTFISTLACSPHLSSMVYEFLQDCFVPDDSMNGFDLFFEVCGHIVWGHIPPLISCLFFASRLLVLEK
jgi:hypothetical protein